MIDNFKFIRSNISRICFLAVLPLLIFTLPSQASADSMADVTRLMPLWRENAPVCQEYPSSQDCEDGDMTLFSGLLCAAGDADGCTAVKIAQDNSGRWHRSPRLASDPSLHPHNSFSWDMALGVQLYAVTTGDRQALERWLNWVERNRPCVAQSPNISGKTYCLVRGWPRWCTDDTENGCAAKPQNLATLVRTVDALGLKLPPPAEDTVPSGVEGLILKELQAQSHEANATFSLERLLPASRGLQPMILLVDATANRDGYPRHLVGVEILLARRLGLGSADVDMAAQILNKKEPRNPFFAYLAGVPKNDVADLLLAVAPRSSNDLPPKRSDWAWQRADSDEAWRHSNLWDFTFMGRLLAKP